MKVGNTAPLTDAHSGKRLKREFLGNLFPTSTDQKNELKAYLAGKTHYFFKNEGIIVAGSITNPVRMKIVRQNFYY